MKSYKAKMVKPTELPSRKEREAALERASYNTFSLDARDVYIDFLTDSGTGAMSAEQWAAMIRGDEVYADSGSFARFTESVHDMIGFEHVVPTHQGRGAENVLYDVLLENGDMVPNDSHFDTIHAHVVNRGAEPVDCPLPTARNPNSTETFKGNFDIDANYTLVEEVGADTIPVVALTIMNNSVAGQPVSVTDIRATARFARDINAMSVIDACRFAEDAHFIKTHEAGYENHSVAEIARTQFEHADAIMMSGKKDALVNIGGFTVMRDETVFEYAKQRTILYGGFPTYGGLSGCDIEAMAIGLREAVIPPYMTDHVEQVAESGDLLVEAGILICQPTDGHAVYLDAGEVFPHIPKEEFPGQELVCVLYLESGVRNVELDGFAFPSTDRPDLVHLALPRHTYSREHLRHVAETAAEMMASAGECGGLEIVTEPPMGGLRHFSSRLEPVSNWWLQDNHSRSPIFPRTVDSPVAPAGRPCVRAPRRDRCRS